MFSKIVNGTVTILNNTMTEKDGQTWCPARILWILSSLFYFGCTVFSIWKGHPFDYIAFGTGFAAIQAAGSAAVKIKETTEQTVHP